MLNVVKLRIKENREIKVKKNIKQVSAKFLALCQENWGSGKKKIFLQKSEYSV